MGKHFAKNTHKNQHFTIFQFFGKSLKTPVPIAFSIIFRRIPPTVCVIPLGLETINENACVCGRFHLLDVFYGETFGKFIAVFACDFRLQHLWGRGSCWRDHESLLGDDIL